MIQMKPQILWIATYIGALQNGVCQELFGVPDLTMWHKYSLECYFLQHIYISLASSILQHNCVSHKMR